MMHMYRMHTSAVLIELMTVWFSYKRIAVVGVSW